MAAQAVRDKGLFERVAAHRKQFFKQGWMDYETLKKGSLRLIPLPEQESSWRSDYSAMRTEMFFTEPPSFDEILTAVRGFEQSFNQG